MKAKEIIKWLETNSLDNEDDDIRICREDFNELKEKCKEQNKVVGVVDNLNNERVATLIKKGCGKGFDFDRNPLICGGKFSNGDCYYCPECRQPEENVVEDKK